MVARVVREFGGIRVDTTDWPVFVFELPVFALADSDIVLAFAYIEQIWRECQRNREKCSLITDASRPQALPPASQRKIAGDWAKGTAELQKIVSVGGACVTPSSIIRGIITAILWIYKPETPVAFFATRDEAMLQAIQWLDEAGVKLPPRLRELRAVLKTKPRARQSSGIGWRP
jgi:hypothetical protein